MAERRDISTSSCKGAREPRGLVGSDAKAARESEDLPFGVVGIGASAGGIDAFRSLLGALAADTGMAYVVVQHLSPDHPSFLAQTLARFTSMPVLEIQDGTRLVPDHVYVMPSNAEVLLSRGTLDVSRIVTGKLRLDQHVVDLGEIVQGAVEEARPSVEMKAVTIETTIARGLTPVYADAARMQQVVSNLLTNAIKFTAPSGTVAVTLERSAAEARITVHDTGMGVPRE